MRKSLVSIAALALALSAIPAAAAPELEEFIVVLHPTDGAVHEVAANIAEAHGGSVGHVYTTALQGFTLTLPDSAVAALTSNPQVAYVEPNQKVYALSTQVEPTGIDRMEADLNPPTVAMDAVEVAVLDTGTYLADKPGGGVRPHLDLNVQWVSDCTGAIFYPMLGGCTPQGDFEDRHGHGTHVAGIIGAYDNDFGSVGAAPGVVLWSFKVLNDDGTGYLGSILAGVDGVTINADKIDIGNLSLGFAGESQALDDAIAASTDAGVLWVVAAGNDGADALGYSPASNDDALTVSALADFDGLPGGLGSPTCRSDQDDTLADFSNYGSAVDIAAPGVCIYSTDLNDGYSVKSGTSMAAPYVAGVAARYIAETGHPTNNRADVNSIKAAILGDAIPQASACGFQDVDSFPEPLLFVNGPAFGGDGTCEGGGTPPPPPPNNPPTASFTASCTDLTCTFTNTSTDPDAGDVLTYVWDFGDTSTSTDTDPTHTYASGGTYTVTLTATDTSLAADTATDTVNPTDPPPPPPNNPPTASFTASCTDLTCTFTNTSSDPDGDPLTYVWDFGDSEPTSAETNPTHTYATGGSYTVTLTATDTSLASDTATVSVNPTDPAPSTDVIAAANAIFVNGRDAEFRASIMDSDGNIVGGATVTGEWTYVHNGRTKTTTQTGESQSTLLDPSIPFENLAIAKKFPPGANAVSFCVTDVSAPGYTFVPDPLTNCTSWVIIVSSDQRRGSSLL